MSISKERELAIFVEYLKLKGYKIYEQDYMGYIVCNDNDCLVFCDIDHGEWASGIPSRERFEKAIAMYIAEQVTEINGIVEMRCDALKLTVIGNDKGIIRHNKNALSAA